MNKLNLIGQKYNRLLVLEQSKSINGRSAWKCKCDCGNIKIVKTEELRGGGTKSCGCLNNEKRSARAPTMYSKRTKYSPKEASARKVWKSNYSEMLFEDFYEMSQKNCDYCGAEPFNICNIANNKSSLKMKECGEFKYNGLDRIENNLPHSKENCVPCCKFCNYAKRERSFEDFRLWIIKVYERII